MNIHHRTDSTILTLQILVFTHIRKIGLYRLQKRQKERESERANFAERQMASRYVGIDIEPKKQPAVSDAR
jgi:hypothetical protein